MAKFITLTNKSDDSTIDVNMDHIESFCTAKDSQGGTKVFPYGLTKEDVESPDYWRVKETPEQIRAMLKGADTFDGIEVTEQEIIDALRMARNVKLKG